MKTTLLTSAFPPLVAALSMGCGHVADSSAGDANDDDAGPIYGCSIAHGTVAVDASPIGPGDLVTTCARGEICGKGGPPGYSCCYPFPSHCERFDPPRDGG